MGRNYDQRLSRAIRRRREITSALTEEAAAIRESQWSRSNLKSVRYALLAMEALDPSYTEKSYEEGGRVINQLRSALEGKEISVSFEYQGSVPLNIHIKHQSDIDILVLTNRVLTYNPNGSRAEYYTATNLSAKEDVQLIREHSESILASAFPAATIDSDGGKSIGVSGGSLARKIDIVPAYWHDDIEYQRTMDKTFRTVCIVHKKTGDIIKNMPFLHIARINEKERVSSSGAKKIIRLLKSLRGDSEPAIDLSSYDIASLVWHFDSDSMVVSPEKDLTLVAIARDNLEYFVNNPQSAAALDSPDGTRKILNEPKKFSALNRLYAEVNELAENIVEELEPLRLIVAKTHPTGLGSAVSNILRESHIPRVSL